MWTYARIDRIEGKQVHCAYCNRPLRSGRVLVIKDSAGAEAYAGPTCAKKHLGSPTEQLLDLSRMAMLLVAKSADQPPASGAVDVGAEEAGSPSSSSSLRTRLDADDAINYLRLRVEHMTSFNGHATERLRGFHAQLDSEKGLSDEARLYIERLLKKAKSTNSIYSLGNIERAIGAQFWLRIAIEHTRPERREFLESMLKSLHESWKLTFGQIQAVNRWGEGVRKSVSDFPVLDTATFSGVSAPSYGGA